MKYSLKELRARKNLTQQELAKKIGTSNKTISNWETNTNNLRGASVREFKKMAEIFGCSMDEIFLGDTSENTNEKECD